MSHHHLLCSSIFHEGNAVTQILPSRTVLTDVVTLSPPKAVRTSKSSPDTRTTLRMTHNFRSRARWVTQYFYPALPRCIIRSHANPNSPPARQYTGHNGTRPPSILR